MFNPIIHIIPATDPRQNMGLSQFSAFIALLIIVWLMLERPDIALLQIKITLAAIAISAMSRQTNHKRAIRP
jgi:hypothetical protein